MKEFISKLSYLLFSIFGYIGFVFGICVTFALLFAGDFPSDWKNSISFAIFMLVIPFGSIFGWSIYLLFFNRKEYFVDNFKKPEYKGEIVLDANQKKESINIKKIGPIEFVVKFIGCIYSLLYFIENVF